MGPAVMDIKILTTVSLIWAIAAITPGPNFFITVHTAVGESRLSSFFTVLGIVAGTFVWAISGYLGVSILFKTVPILYYSIKIIGGLYLTYIGISLLLSKKKNNIETKDKKALSRFNCFKLGLYTILLNPKTAAFMTSLFAATIPPDASIKFGILCVVLICSISALWYSIVAAVFSSNWSKNAYAKYKSYIEKAAGSIFIIFGVKLAVSK
jgi:threonine/homoserine/homoserine lactone efflux protein